METRKYLFETLWKQYLTEAQEGIGGTVVIDNLEVALSDFWTNSNTTDVLNRGPEDFPLDTMAWDDATRKLKALGDGWRLPSIEEFKTILQPNQSKLKVHQDLGSYLYWSSTPREDSEFGYKAWTFNLNNKNRGGGEWNGSATDRFGVLAVRDASYATKN